MLKIFAFQKARQLEKQKKWQQAFDIYQKIETNTANPSAELVYRLGFVAEKRKQFNVALKWLEQAVQKKPNQQQWLWRYAQVALKVGAAPRAVEAYEQSDKSLFTDVKWHYGVARRLENNKNYLQAARFYGQALQFNPNDSNYSYRLGRSLQQAADYSGAIAAYEQAMVKGKVDTDVLVCLGRSLLEAEQFSQAELIYKQLLDLTKEKDLTDTTCINSYYLLGEVLVALDRAEEALSYLEAVVETNPKYSLAWFALYKAQHALGQNQQALQSLSKAAALQPTNSRWQVMLGESCSLSGPFGVGATAWARALKAEPKNEAWRLQHALALDMAGKTKEAINSYQQLLKLKQTKTEIENSDQVLALELYIQALQLHSEKQYKEAQEPFAQAVELAGEHTPVHWHYRLGQVLFLGGRATEAEAPIQQAISLSPTNQYYVHALAQAIRRQGRTWQEVDVLQQVLEVATSPTNANINLDFIAKWYFELGDAQDKMNRFVDSAEAFAKANVIKPDNAIWHFREGYAWERADQFKQSEQAYNKAIELDRSLKAKDFGIGVFHQQRGFWPQAAEAYEKTLQKQSCNAELLYRLGFAHDRCYRWQDAENYFNQAIAMNMDCAEWHYRLGFVLERQEKFELAAQAYEFAAITRETHTPYWFYRLGYVLNQMGNYEQACEAFLQMQQQAEIEGLLVRKHSLFNPYEAEIEGNNYLNGQKENLKWLLKQDGALSSVDPAEAYYKLGEQAERYGLWEEAAQAYQQAIDRGNDHQSNWYYRLGYVLVKQGIHELAAYYFINSRILQLPHGVTEKPFNDSESFRLLSTYAEYYKCLKVNEHSFLFESFNGKSLTCNPYALFIYLYNSDYYKDFKFIVVLNDLSKAPEEFRNKKNVFFVKKGSDQYLRALCECKYLINNSGFPPYFVRKESQSYLATWHGTPLKTLGKEQKYKFFDHKRTQRNFLQATHIISPNEHTTNILFDSYDIRSIYTGKLAETGYPRIDLTINRSELDKIRLKNKIGLNDTKPIVLYAPTWRGTLQEVNIDTEQLERDVREIVKKECQVIFRGHSLLEERLKDIELDCIVVPESIDTNELLSIVDILITDYSSVFFDFIPINKPIIYYTYDLDEYEFDRGLYFSFNQMPGVQCNTLDELLLEIDFHINNRSFSLNGYENAVEKFNCLDNGFSSERVVSFFMENDSEYVVDPNIDESKDNILFFPGGMEPNGITTSFINLINHLDFNKTNPVVVFSPNNVERYKDNLEQFSRLDYSLDYIPRYGNVVMTLEEHYLRFRFDQRYYNDMTIEQENILDDMYYLEYKRIMGNSKIDALIHFSGYDVFFLKIFSSVKKIKKSIYLHNDLYSEYEKKYPSLICNFKLYSEYDKLISVSLLTSNLNEFNLSEKFSLCNSKFIYCDNIQNPRYTLEMADEPLTILDEAYFSNSDDTIFITMGRLSVEKDHVKLINAFYQLHKIYHNIKLLILGDGPLKNDLLNLIDSLDLNNVVHILGRRFNPFPLLKRADCFVLSSNHEGQPMVLFEAMILSKPIIATDIVGSRSVIEGRSGLLVENTINGLVEGISDFLEKKINLECFNIDDYQRDAIDMFYNKVL